MKRLFALLTGMFLLTGCAGHASEPTHGLNVTVEAEGIYSISCSTEYHTEVGQNADNTELDAGSSLFFSPSEGEVHYTISVANTAGKTVASGNFTHDFSDGLVKLVVTEDLEIVPND